MEQNINTLYINFFVDLYKSKTALKIEIEKMSENDVVVLRYKRTDKLASLWACGIKIIYA